MKRAPICLVLFAAIGALGDAPVAMWRPAGRHTGKPVPTQFQRADVSGVVVLQEVNPGRVLETRIAWPSLRPDQLAWLVQYHWAAVSNYPAARAANKGDTERRRVDYETGRSSLITGGPLFNSATQSAAQ